MLTWSASCTRNSMKITKDKKTGQRLRWSFGKMDFTWKFYGERGRASERMERED